MQTAEASQIVEHQRRYFATGKTRPVAFRVEQLKKLKAAIEAREDALLASLKKDLGKPAFEAYSSEIGFMFEEINHAIKHVKGWARPRPVSTPLIHQPSSSRVVAQPKGVVLVIGAWNYPVQLILGPLVGAIAAGNCAVVKPSELAMATAEEVTRLLAETFPPEYCAVVNGGVLETTQLLRERFDHIFFTGSSRVGRVVMRAAAEHLTPVTLELGGKSPTIVDTDIDIGVTARRIVWGKFYNTGQTCVAPDYLVAPKSIKAELLNSIRQNIVAFWGDDPKTSPDYGRIINERHFDRLVGLIQGEVIIGGQNERASLYIAPTLIDNVELDAPVMTDEIFGPILPVIPYDTLTDAIAIVAHRPNPLACYVFTNRKSVSNRIIEELPFGGGCVNNTLIHLANPNLPFGGVGYSGMGTYHGAAGFEAFSHRKGITYTTTSVDIKVRYPPYKNRIGLMRWLMR